MLGAFFRISDQPARPVLGRVDPGAAAAGSSGALIERYGCATSIATGTSPSFCSPSGLLS